MLGKVGAGEGPKADPELDDTMRYQLKARVSSTRRSGTIRNYQELYIRYIRNIPDLADDG